MELSLFTSSSERIVTGIIYITLDTQDLKSLGTAVLAGYQSDDPKMSRAPLGELIAEPSRVLISQNNAAGRPNAGK